MNRLRRPGDSDYDVLGVSPDATDEEIAGAYSRLIEEQGYKADVPLKCQWARAREIKAAYATLADPARRQAYNESLGLPSDPSAWLATTKDPATDELVLREMEPAAQEPAEMNGVRHELVPDLAHDLIEQDGAWYHDRPPPPYLAPAHNDNEPTPVRKHHVLGVAVHGVALLLIASFPWWNFQLPSAEIVRNFIADAVRKDPAPTNVSHPQAQAPRSREGPAAPEIATRDAPKPVSRPEPSPALSRPVEPQRATSEPTIQKVEEPAESEPAPVQPSADEAPADVPASTAEPSEAPTEPIEEQAPPPPPAPAPQPRVAPSTANAQPRVRPPPRFTSPPVRRQARWLGGGPTNADNRRGQYRGTVNVQVAVGPNGRVSSCAPVRGSGNPGLDALTCRLVRQRARFAPALDARGRPVASQAYATFVWGSVPRR